MITWKNARHGLLVTSLTLPGITYAQDPLKSPQTPAHSFRVNVSLSEKAKKKLVDSKETVIAIAYFTGSPKAGTPFRQYKQFASRPGPMGLGENEVEALPGEGLTFQDLKLKQGALPLLDSQGLQLLINVVSGGNRLKTIYLPATSMKDLSKLLREPPFRFTAS